MALSKTQRKKLDSLLRDVCLTRDGFKCIRCGNDKVKELSASHIYPKGTHQSMRYNIDNVKTLDYKCHIHFWHKHPLEASEWLKKTIDPKRLKRLKKASQTNLGLKKRYVYEEIKQELEKALRRLQKDD